jgi:hypothetical protein
MEHILSRACFLWHGIKERKPMGKSPLIAATILALLGSFGAAAAQRGTMYDWSTLSPPQAEFMAQQRDSASSATNENARSAVTSSQAGSAKMHQPARAAGTNLQWFEDVVKPRMAAANWRAEEGD